MVALCKTFSNHIDVDTLLLRFGVDFVINVCDVSDIGDFWVECTQHPYKPVEYDRWPGVADMRRTINGRPANIQAHMVFVQWRERHFLLVRALVNLNLHVLTLINPRNYTRMFAEGQFSVCWLL